MSAYLNHDEILAYCQQGYMKNWDEGCVNAASLDLRLGNTILTEEYPGTRIPVVDYGARQRLNMVELTLSDEGFLVRPGQFFLAHTQEICNFPDNVAALYRIKSSMGRVGLEHCDAGWVDPGFNGALTLEFFNVTQHHTILLRPGDKIGQLIFLRGNEVSAEQSYRTKGNYNGNKGVAQVGFKEPA